ncbi:MAG: SurA N-terminal domain-containing protein [Myxococcales bacterium]|jgi:peptidyl-prolyl cis-trans isomerase D|nr:SurA N-terminal domain-containing protein [Myxococcales bacterium]
MLLANLRKNSRSSILIFLFGIIIIVFIFSFGPASTGCRSGSMGPGDGFAAKVNGQKISRMDFERAYARQLDAMRERGQEVTREQADALGLGHPILDQLIDRELLIQAAKAEGLRVSDEDVRAELDKVPNFKQDGAFSQELYKDIVERQLGMMMWQFEDQIRDGLLVQKMVAGLSGAAKASDDEVTAELMREKEKYALSLVRFQVRAQKADLDAPTAEAIDAFAASNADTIKAHYEQFNARYNTPKQVHARHILVKTSPTMTEAQAIAKVKALKAKVEGGADFAELAKAESEDPGSKDKGGDLGKFGEGTMVPAFQNAAFAMKPGDISEPVVTQFGVHLIKVEDVQEAKVISLEEVTPSIAKELLIDDLAKAKAKAKAEATLEALKAGKSLAEQWPAEATEGATLPLGAPRVEETGDFRLTGDYIPRIGTLAALAQDLPTMKEGAADKVYEGNEMFVVLSLDKHEKANLDELKDPATMSSQRQALEEKRATEALDSLLSALRNKAKIQKNEAVVGPSGMDALLGLGS